MKILITGGSRGIGNACVRLFSSQGHEVAFIYKNAHESAQALEKETGAFPICADISIPAEAKKAVESALNALGSIDVLVNNAGIAQSKMAIDVTPDDFKTMLDTNLGSAFFTTQSVLDSMVHQKFGRIINIGSMWGKVGASCESHYSASKAALRGLTMSLAKELGPSGITVNCVEPGLIDTDMNSFLDRETIKELASETPLGRIGSPLDVAELVAFLASDKASFITGQIIGVDGGFAI